MVKSNNADQLCNPSIEEHLLAPSSSKTVDLADLPNKSAIIMINSQEQRSTHERLSCPSLEEQCSTHVPNNISALVADANMIDAEVANINTNSGCDSLEDITVYEVVTKYQNTPQWTVANIPHYSFSLVTGK